MNKLSYSTIKDVGYDGYILENAPEKVLQFGEGNFLRAFVDYFNTAYQSGTCFHDQRSGRSIYPVPSWIRKR